MTLSTKWRCPRFWMVHICQCIPFIDVYSIVTVINSNAYLNWLTYGNPSMVNHEIMNQPFIFVIFVVSLLVLNISFPTICPMNFIDFQRWYQVFLQLKKGNGFWLPEPRTVRRGNPSLLSHRPLAKQWLTWLKHPKRQLGQGHGAWQFGNNGNQHFVISKLAIQLFLLCWSFPCCHTTWSCNYRNHPQLLGDHFHGFFAVLSWRTSGPFLAILKKVTVTLDASRTKQLPNHATSHETIRSTFSQSQFQAISWSMFWPARRFTKKGQVEWRDTNKTRG